MKPEGLTPSQTIGPFFGFALPYPDGPVAVLVPDAARIEGQLFDGAGEPVPDGLLELWQGDQFARCRTDPEGAFHFVIGRPGPLPGPNGVAQAPHWNLTIFARGLLKELYTRVYLPGSEATEADPVLQAVEPGRRHTLIARDDGGVLHIDVRLQGEGETVFFAV